MQNLQHCEQLTRVEHRLCSITTEHPTRSNFSPYQWKRFLNNHTRFAHFIQGCTRNYKAISIRTQPNILPSGWSEHRLVACPASVFEHAVSVFSGVQFGWA